MDSVKGISLVSAYFEFTTRLILNNSNLKILLYMCGINKINFLIVYYISNK